MHALARRRPRCGRGGEVARAATAAWLNAAFASGDLPPMPALATRLDNDHNLGWLLD